MLRLSHWALALVCLLALPFASFADAAAAKPPMAGGKVTAVDAAANTITVDAKGTPKTWKVDANTKYDVAGNATATIADITAGLVIKIVASASDPDLAAEVKVMGNKPKPASSATPAP